MALFDFFKKLKKESIEEDKMQIHFSEIRSYLEKIESENRIREEEVFDLIKGKTDEFVKGAREKIKIAEAVNIDSKKAEDSYKAVTDSGRKKYIESVEDFILHLEELPKKNLEKFIEDLNRLFSVFNKGSRKNYERATVLLGKEMKDIRDHLKSFSENLKKIFEKNKDIIHLYRKISLLIEKLNKIDEIKKSHGKIKNEISSLNEKIKGKKEEIEKFSYEIEKIKSSEDYLKNQKIKEKIDSLKSESDKSILELQKLVDFKALANFFHIFENQMEIVKAYREDFKTRFKKDNGESLINLLNESKLNNEKISEKINEIKNKKDSITNYQKELTKDNVENLSGEIKKINSEIDELHSEKERKNRIDEKLETDRNELKTEIKDRLKEMGVVVE